MGAGTRSSMRCAIITSWRRLTFCAKSLPCESGVCTLPTCCCQVTRVRAPSSKTFCKTLCSSARESLSRPSNASSSTSRLDLGSFRSPFCSLQTGCSHGESQQGAGSLSRASTSSSFRPSNSTSNCRKAVRKAAQAEARKASGTSACLTSGKREERPVAQVKKAEQLQQPRCLTCTPQRQLSNSGRCSLRLRSCRRSACR